MAQAPYQQAAMDSLIQATMRRYQLPGLALGVVRQGKIIRQQGYGYTHIKTRTPVTENSLFHTASVSKLFTAQAIYRLVAAKKLNWETPLATLDLPWRWKQGKAGTITIRQLLTHQSGLQDISNYHWRQGHTAPDAMKNYFTRKKPVCLFPPGTRTHYSNLGYDLLALIVQQQSGMAFEDYAQQHVLQPAGMLQSDYRYFEVPQAQRVRPHGKNILGKPRVKTLYPYTREHAGSSTLHANVAELNQWMIGFMQQQTGIACGAAAAVYTNSFPGFQVYRHQSHLLIGHYGGDKGFRSFLMMDPCTGIGMVVLANAGYGENFRNELLFGLYDMMMQDAAKQ